MNDMKWGYHYKTNICPKLETFSFIFVKWASYKDLNLSLFFSGLNALTLYNVINARSIKYAIFDKCYYWDPTECFFLYQCCSICSSMFLLIETARKTSCYAQIPGKECEQTKKFIQLLVNYIQLCSWIDRHFLEYKL